MLQPPVTDLAPWRPGSFLMDDGSAYDAYQMHAVLKSYPEEVEKMLKASRETYLIIERVIAK